MYSFCSLNAEMALITAKTGGLLVHSMRLSVKNREIRNLSFPPNSENAIQLADTVAVERGTVSFELR